MKLSKRTILITGGTSGIGLELAAEFLARDNVVIVTGRDPDKLASTRRRLPRVHAVQSDVSDAAAVAALAARVVAEFPALDVLINNAGVMRKINLHRATDDLEDLTREVETNLMGPMRLTASLLPQLKSRPEAAIVNVTSVVATTPLAVAPIYSATKAGLHSYTRALRAQLRDTAIKVFELAPPGVDTPLLDGFSLADRGGSRGMDVADLARATVRALEKDQFEIRPGLSRAVHALHRLAPEFVAKQFAKSLDQLLASQNEPPN